jgi:hypothetical protein
VISRCFWITNEENRIGPRSIVADIEEFLNHQPNNRPRRLTVLRQFFRFARTAGSHRPDPRSGSQAAHGISRRTLTVDALLHCATSPTTSTRPACRPLMLQYT